MAEGGWIAIPAIPVGLWIVIRGVRRGVGAWTVMLRLLVLVHLATVAGVAFFPFPFQPEVVRAGGEAQLASNNVVPLRSLIDAVATGASPSVIDQSIGNS